MLVTNWGELFRSEAISDDMNFNNTGFGTVEETITVSEDGKTYLGEGPLQFFDNSGNPLGPPTTILDSGTRIA